MFSLVCALIAALGTAAAAAFDHSHRAWDELLKKNVVVAPSGFSAAVRYAQRARQRPALQSDLASLSVASPTQYAAWAQAQRLAFLLKADNAVTVELILARYPDLKSIKDLGNFLQSPWKKRFFRLPGEERSPDDIEQSLIRGPGAFDDPRIHFTVVCASVGCPISRNEAYVAARLDAQRDDAMRRIPSDRTRNKLEVESGRLAESRIFDWYGRDLERGRHGAQSVQAFLACNAGVPVDRPRALGQIRAGRFSVSYLDYDWSLSDAR
jgi:hypothetical protein